jgi:hypothetical protein
LTIEGLGFQTLIVEISAQIINYFSKFWKNNNNNLIMPKL